MEQTVHYSTVPDTQEESVDEIMERVFGENWNDELKRVVMKNTPLTVIQTEWHIKCRLVHPHSPPSPHHFFPLLHHFLLLPLHLDRAM